MSFDEIIGNKALTQTMKGMAESGRIPHAMLIYENEGCGALSLVQAFINYLNKGQKSDIHYTFPITSGTKVTGKVQDLTCDMFAEHWKELMENNPYFLENDLNAALGFEKKTGSITVAEGKSILRKLSLSSLTDGYRAIIIWLPERMNQSAANMLLKAIEEPAPDNIFFLITHSPESVLPTISSRCQPMRLMPLPKEELKIALVERFCVSEDDAQSLSLVSGGSIGTALNLLGERTESVEIKDLFISLLEAILRRDYLGSLEIGEAVASLDSREKQKAFCTFAVDCIRKIFIVKNNMHEISGIMPEEIEFYKEMASKCKDTFYQSAAEYIGKAAQMIDRNVNQKIIITNLVNRLFVTA